MQEEQIKEWQGSGENFCQQGNFAMMRACGSELLEFPEAVAEGYALIAEASVYLQDMTRAKEALEKMTLAEEQCGPCLRGRLAQGLYYGSNYHLQQALSAYEAFVAGCEKSPAQVPQSMRLRGYSFLADLSVLCGYVERGVELTQSISRELSGAAQSQFYSKALFLKNFRPWNLAEAKAEHEIYGQRLLAQLGQEATPKQKIQLREEARPLRIGYISPDFRRHALGYFLAPLLQLSPEDFEIYVYFLGQEDQATKKFQKLATVWRGVQQLSPEEIAHIIAQDKIDILVDLAGHSNQQVLPVLARKPAPIQISGLGYINTTGLSTVDYFLSDSYAMTPAGAEAFGEKILYFPECHLCYAPEFIRPKLSQSQRARQKHTGVVLGCFNNYDKITDEMLGLWQQILAQLPEGKLLLKNKLCSLPEGQNLIRQRCSEAGILPEQLVFLPFTAKYLPDYRQVDIALDTAPYNGGLTTCDALYMGVPVVSLAGNSHGSRYGVTILHNAGLGDLVANTPEEYVAKVVDLALDAPRRAKLHGTLVASLPQSPLMNIFGYNQALEKIFKKIWKNACQK